MNEKQDETTMKNRANDHYFGPLIAFAIPLLFFFVLRITENYPRDPTRSEIINLQGQVSTKTVSSQELVRFLV